MTEREKMLHGLCYDSRDSELIAMYWRAREVLQVFNGRIDDRSRMAGLRALLVGVESDVWIEPLFFCEYGAHIQIGSGS
jgi:maltose O-acetyltransferase